MRNIVDDALLEVRFRGFCPKGAPRYVDSCWLTVFPPFSMADALRLLVGVPLPERENSVSSWIVGSLNMATGEEEKGEISNVLTPKLFDQHYIC